MCKQELSYKSILNNLKKYIEQKHPSVNVTSSNNIEPQPIQNKTTINNANANSEPQSANCTDKTSNIRNATEKSVKQASVTTFLKRKMGVTERKKRDNSFMLLFIKGFQPFSIVEELHQ